jgi:hypothetical protein
VFTNWRINFVDGTHILMQGATIDEAIKQAEFEQGKYVRSALFHHSYMSGEVTNHEQAAA